MPHIKSINHVGIVVDNIEKSLFFWRDALGLGLRELRDVLAEDSQVAFLPVETSEVELIRPTTQDSGIARYLSKRGAGLHHICLEVDDIDGMLKQLAAKGIRLISDEPRRRPDGTRYAFVHPESTGGVLVELYQVV